MDRASSVALTGAQVEVKRFLTESDGKFYCSFQTGFRARKFVDDDPDSLYAGHVGTGAAYSSAVIHSPVLSFAPKIAIDTSLGKTLFLDAFIGFGVRILLNRYNASGPRPTTAFHKREWGPDPAWTYNQTVTRFHLPVGLGLGVRF